MAGLHVIALTLLSFCGTGVLGEYKINKGVPTFCGSYECPKFQVLKKYDTFELREYGATQWVTTYLELDGLGLGIMKSFRRLYSYITGGNSEGLSLEMNVPVRVTVPLKDSTINATISLFLPSALSNPPTPKDRSLVLESFPPTSFYVRCFGGYALKSDFEKQSKVLVEALTSLGLPFQEEYGMAAAYNDPLTFFKRHNEVWFRSHNQETR